MNILEKYTKIKENILRHYALKINDFKLYTIAGVSEYYKKDDLEILINDREEWNEIITLISCNINEYYKNKLKPLREENKKIELQLKSINEMQDFMIEIDTPIDSKNNKNDEYRDEAVESLEDLFKTIWNLFKKLYKVLKSL